MRFNPPPNWPRPPEGWSPPPGWEPDPSWPPLPWGWPLWVDEYDTIISPSRATPPPQIQPWYLRTITVVLSLVFFFPVGLVLLWKRPDWSLRRRGAITALIAGLVIVGAAAPKPPPTTTTQLSPTTSLSTVSPPSSPTVSSAASLPSTTVSTTTTSVPTTSAPSAPAKSTAPAAAPPPAPATTTHAAPAPPAPPPTTKAAPPPSTCGAPSNPYGYNFCGVGGHVTNPPGDICTYFNCIASFWNGNGYMVECNDATYSMSGGISGACSHHGGEDRAVYSG